MPYRFEHLDGSTAALYVVEDDLGHLEIVRPDGSTLHFDVESIEKTIIFLGSFGMGFTMVSGEDGQ